MDSSQRIQGGILRIDSKCYPIFKGVNTVGRNRTAIVNVRNLNVSQNQALVILVDETQHFVTDMNSSNGTFLGNTKLVPFILYELKNNTDVTFGDVQATYIKVSNCNNINNNLLNQTLETTQNMTQNFYAANTQLMDGDESHFEHNYININNKSEAGIINDIHKEATQEANVSSYFGNFKKESNKATPDTVTTQIISEEEVITNIHDAPTQEMTFRPPIQVNNENREENIVSNKARSDTVTTQIISEEEVITNIHDALTQDITFRPPIQVNNENREENVVHGTPTETVYKDFQQQNSLQLGPSTSGDNTDKQLLDNPSCKSVSQESSGTIILNTEAIKVNDITEENPTISSPGLSVSQNKIFDDSSLNNSRNISVTQNIAIEESVIEGNLAESIADSNSNDSVDFLANASVVGNELENIEVSRNENLSVFENISSHQEKPQSSPIRKTVGSDSDTDIESDNTSRKSSQGSISIGTVRKKPLQKLPSSNDTEDAVEVQRPKKILSRKKQHRNCLSDSDSENEIESTQDIGLIKKPLKKLDSEDESTSVTEKNTNCDSDTDCEGVVFDQAKVQDSELVKENKCNSSDPIKGVTEKSFDKPLVQNLDENILSVASNIDCDDNLKKECQMANETEASTSKKDSYCDRNSTSDDKLNDTDCIPATQDAFAEAFSYRSQGGKSSSTEDFRLGLTQLMEDSLNDEISKSLEPNVNSIGEKNDEKEVNKQQEIKDADDIYLMATQHINDAKATQTDLVATNVEDDDVYVMATQKMVIQKSVPSTSKTYDNNVYDMATQQLSEANVETEKDDDVYLLATQPINKESQFKVPKTFTFKKKHAAILEESLSTLLGDNKDTEVDVFGVPTQIISVPQKLPEHHKQSVKDKDDDFFDVPTQKIAEPQEIHENYEDDDVFEVPTQKMSEPRNSRVKDELHDSKHSNIDINKVKVETNIVPQTFSSSNEKSGSMTSKYAEDLFDLPTQAFPTEIGESSNTQDELEFCTTNHPPSSEKNRPENPLAHVLNEDDKSEPISAVPALRRSRRKSSSPLPEPPQSKRQKNLKEPKKMSKISEERPYETVSQIEDFIKRSEEDISLKITEELSNTKPTILKTIDEDKDDIETLSQIEAFIKKPVEKTYSRTRVSKRLTDVKEIVEASAGPSNPTEKFKSLTDIKSSKPKRTSKRILPTHDESDLIVKEEPPISASVVKNNSEEAKSVHQTSESEGNCSYKDQEVIKSDVDQSFALLESKASKSRKKPIDPVLQDFKVTISSHRRSMGIAETSVVAANKARRATVVAPSSSRSKRKVQEGRQTADGMNEDSDSSDMEAPKRKVSRGKSSKKNKDETKNDTSRTSTIVREAKKATNTKKSASSTNTTTSTRSRSEKENEIEDDFEVKMVDITKEVTKQDTKLSSKSKEIAHDAPSRRAEPKTPKRGRSTTQKTKNEQDLHQGTSSEGNSSTDVMSTPEKQRNIATDVLLNSAERAKRKLKPKVVFTMLDDPQLESLIRQLGGSIVDSVNTCTVLVTERVKRSQKLLSAVGQGKPVCSPQWIKESKKAGQFLDPWNFILIDKEAEKKWTFSLKDSIQRAVSQKLLTNYTFQIMATNGADVLKGAIEACGGKCISKQPGKNSEGNFAVIASPDQKSKYTRIVKQNPNIKIIEAEAIFDGVLRQELRLSNHLLT